NPIVLRDLRSTMRGTRAFWFQGAYLFLLGVLAVAGYASSTGQDLVGGITGRGDGNVMSIVDAQGRLQGFYTFIFVTLAALITLIAPALTATSVSDERQRQSLDLLTTTPLSAPEMLLGKLMSSLAFLGLLLALSLPASVLCAMLGGATVWDLLRAYALLAVDAVVLASIGLYFSCACRSSLHAIIWTYAAVLVFVGIGYGAFALGMITGDANLMTPVAAIGMLSPLAAITSEARRSIAIGAVHVPLWLAMLPFAVLAVRLFLTAATYRFGAFGAASGKSLRKQLLFVTGLATLIAGYSLGKASGFADTFLGTDGDFRPVMDQTPQLLAIVCAVFAGFFVLALPFLPGLFVPVRAEDAPPGDAQEAHTGDTGYFSVRAMFLPRHSGALPYFYAWFGVAVAGLLTGIFVATGRVDALTLQTIALPTFYVLGTGTLMWGLSRLCARFIRSASSARALAFGAFLMLNLLPALPLSLMGYETTPWAFLPWLGSFIAFAGINEGSRQYVPLAIAVSANAALITGLVMGLVCKPRNG
ncbi:MAG: ABC transporter permease subunit, partial [Armatimonadetes bacterium]|nr:ABC transporter permease subunit [Armatimonadota bacterium]